MSVLALIQARMGSTRLPGKSMALLSGIPLIEHVIKRVHASNIINHVCVATTTHPDDDTLAAHVASVHNTDVYRGDEHDVLGRFFAASLTYPEADVIVRVTADDPFKDPELIDYALTGFLAEWADASSQLPPPQVMHLGGITWPLGLDVELFTRHALKTAHAEATDPQDREHVTPWMVRTFGVWIVKNKNGKGSINDRWTIDTAEDLAFARAVYDRLYPQNPVFGFRDLILAGYCNNGNKVYA